MRKRFQGMFAPLTTPFKDEEVILEKFQENIQKYNSIDLSGYVISGSTAESVYLSDEEIAALVKSAKKTASPDRVIIVGTAKESTKMTMEFSGRIADLGVDATLIRTPGYFKGLMTQEALKKHYLTLADKAKVPLIIYHIPRFTGVDITAELLATLSRHEMIAGIKDSSGNMTFLDSVIPLLDTKFVFLIGAGGMLLPGLMMGASGGILALSDIVPALCSRLYDLFLEKKWGEAKKLQHVLVPLNQALTVQYGIPAIKYALDLIGFYGGPCRLPLMPLGKPDRQKIRAMLEVLGLITSA